MGITNYKVDKIEASVESRKFESVDVRNSFMLGKVTKPENTEKLLEVDWQFTSDYKKFGKVHIEGSLVYFDDKIEDMFEEKGKDKLVLRGDALREVSNFVLRRGIVESIVVSRTLQMPVPMQMPSVKVKENGGQNSA